MSSGTEKRNHALSLVGRSEMQISGVQEVVSFDEERVSLRTLCGDMTVEGGELRIGVLDTERGMVTVHGRVDAVFYAGEDSEEKRGFLGRLFR